MHQEEDTAPARTVHQCWHLEAVPFSPRGCLKELTPKGSLRGNLDTPTALPDKAFTLAWCEKAWPLAEIIAVPGSWKRILSQNRDRRAHMHLFRKQRELNEPAAKWVSMDDDPEVLDLLRTLDDQDPDRRWHAVLKNLHGNCAILTGSTKG